MSYEDRRCPCGGEKQTDTMLCAECVEEFKEHPATSALNNHEQSREYRRNAAIILLALARKRKRKAVAE